MDLVLILFIALAIVLLVAIGLAVLYWLRTNKLLLSEQLLTEKKLENTALNEQLKAAQNNQQRLDHALLQSQSQLQQIQQLNDKFSDDIARLTERNQQMIERLNHEQQRQQQLETNYQQTQQQSQTLANQLTQATTKLEAEQNQSQEKLQLLQQAKEQLSLQFKELANKILEDKSQSFLVQNQQQLGQILTPFNTKLVELQTKVEHCYNDEGQQRAGMMQQIKQLIDLNQLLSKDAKNLTNALKGSSKTQGNWGEMILQRVLDLAGFTEGREYDVQLGLKGEENNNRQHPDVVIHLPGDRHLIVDSKVSLIAYEAFMQAQDDEQLRQREKTRHIDSIRKHINELSEKKYQTLYGIEGIDFVLMFVPIEPAFMLAITEDDKLFTTAWQRNILLVSPSTLLFVVRTVAHLWRQEAQTANAYAIAKAGEQLYDELVAFVTDLEQVGNRLQQTQNSYENAFKKLSTKRGNVIRRAEQLKQLGVKPTKQFSAKLKQQLSLDEQPTELADELVDEQTPTKITN